MAAPQQAGSDVATLTNSASIKLAFISSHISLFAPPPVDTILFGRRPAIREIKPNSVAATDSAMALAKWPWVCFGFAFTKPSSPG